MKTKPKKSLGMLRWPNLELKSFDGITGLIELEISTGAKRVRILSGYYYFARLMVECAQEITARKRDYANNERMSYLALKKLTGYVPKDGGE